MSDILKDLEDAASGFSFVLTVNDHERVIELMTRAATEIRRLREGDDAHHGALSSSMVSVA